MFSRRRRRKVILATWSPATVVLQKSALNLFPRSNFGSMIYLNNGKALVPTVL
jgi:hypothetical protein